MLEQFGGSGLVNLILGGPPRLITKVLGASRPLYWGTIGTRCNRRFPLFLDFFYSIIKEEQSVLGRFGSLCQKSRFFLADTNGICQVKCISRGNI